MTRPDSPLRARRRRRAALRAAIAGAAAIAAAADAPHLTGDPLADRVWVAASAALLVLATARSRRSAWIVASAVLMAVSGGGAGTWLSLAALLVAVASSVPAKRDPDLGALVGALLAAASVRLQPIDLQHAAAASVALAWIWPIASALRLATREERRVARAVLAGAATAFVAGLLAFLWAAGGAMRSIDAAGAELRAAVRAGANDDRSLPDHIGAARAELLRADASMQGTVSDAAAWFPLVGRQAEAMRSVTSIGADLGLASAGAVEIADYRRLAMDDQQIDIDQLISMRDPLETLRDALARSDDELTRLDMGWLLTPVSSRIEDFRREVAGAIPGTDLALEALDVAPALLGEAEQRHYLIAFTQPSEARGLGGFVGSYAELTVSDGRIEMTASGSMDDLVNAPGAPDRVLRGPADYVARYRRFQVEHYLMDVTMSPHMPSVAEVLADQYRQATGTEVDGVLVVDPFATAAFLEVAGPVNLPGVPFQLDSTNAAAFLLAEQYELIDEDDEREALLEEASRRVFQRMLRRRVFEPVRMGRILGPVVAEERLLAWSRHPDEQSLIERLGMDGSLTRPNGGDLLAVVSQNSGNDKIDHYLRRRVRYDVEWDPSVGRLEGTVTVTLHNEAPTSGLPAYVTGVDDGLPLGTNEQILSIFTALVGAELRVDGSPVPVDASVERGLRVYSTDLVIPPGGTAEVTLSVAGRIDGTDLALRWDPQPLATPDEVEVQVRGAAGWIVRPGARQEPSSGPQTLQFQAKRAP